MLPQTQHPSTYKPCNAVFSLSGIFDILAARATSPFMTVHLIKLSVGTENFADLQARQQARLLMLEKSGKQPELIHTTRNKPRRANEILDGGSIFWVVKGGIIARQKMLDIRTITLDGVPHCELVFDTTLVSVQWQPRRAFQGWRYLEEQDAPQDRDVTSQEDEMPQAMRQELMRLGLL